MSQIGIIESSRPSGSPLLRPSWRQRLNSPWSFETRWWVIFPAVLLFAATLLFRNTDLDLKISSWFYDQSSREWAWFFWGPCTTFYRKGIYPPFLLGGCGGIMFVYGLWFRAAKSWRRAGLFLVLLMAIGPGLIVNLVFKTHWGRARPHEVQEFGGRHPYSPVGTPGPMLNRNSSFPSGHAALAFYMIAPAFLVGRKRPQLATVLFILGILYGLGMSLTRVAQGGHFASDVLWSGGIMYLVAAILAKRLLTDDPRDKSIRFGDPERSNPTSRPQTAARSDESNAIPGVASA